MSKVKQNGESTLSQSVEVESNLFCICLDVLYREGEGFDQTCTSIVLVTSRRVRTLWIAS